MFTDSMALFVQRGQYPSEQQVEAKKEPTSKTRQVLAFAKDVTLVVGGTFGALLAINYVGREMQHQGMNLVGWRDPLKTNDTYCFNVGLCTENPTLIAGIKRFGAALMDVGLKMENTSGDILQTAIAPFYTAYRASGGILERFSLLYNSNIKPLICAEPADVDTVESTLMSNVQEWLGSTGESIKGIFDSGMESLSRIPNSALEIAAPLLIAGGIIAADHHS